MNLLLEYYPPFLKRKKIKRDKGNDAQKVPSRISRERFVVKGNSLIPKSLARNNATINAILSIIKAKIKTLYRG